MLDLSDLASLLFLPARPVCPLLAGLVCSCSGLISAEDAHGQLARARGSLLSFFVVHSFSLSLRLYLSVSLCISPYLCFSFLFPLPALSFYLCLSLAISRLSLLCVALPRLALPCLAWSFVCARCAAPRPPRLLFPPVPSLAPSTAVAPAQGPAQGHLLLLTLLLMWRTLSNKDLLVPQTLMATRFGPVGAMTVRLGLVTVHFCTCAFFRRLSSPLA